MGWPQTRQDHLVTPRRCQSLMSRGSLSSSSNKRSSSSSTSNAGARKRAGKQTNKKDSNSNLLRPACASIPSAQSWYAPLLYDFLVGSSTNTPEKTGPTAKISNGGQKRRAAAASGRKKHANPTMTTLQEDVAASSHNSRQRKSNAGGGGGRSPPGVAIVAACAMACMLCVGGATLAFSSRGWLGGGEELEASRLATTATAESKLTEARAKAKRARKQAEKEEEHSRLRQGQVEMENSRRKLARRPELKTRGGQLAFARFTLLGEYPHDREAFTQGLSFLGGYLYESTGLFHGKSSLRKVEPETGKVVQIVNLEGQYFGEGSTILNDEIHSLTWRSQVGFTWDLETFEKKKEFTFTTKTNQGWGMTTNGDSLIVSDGSAFLFFWDPQTMTETRRVEVMTEDGRSLGKINELEFIKGYVFANVWFDDHLYKIDPATGQVVDTYNFVELYPPHLRKQELHSREACLNGIAWDPIEDVVYLTGKLWPRVYKVKLNEEEDE